MTKASRPPFLSQGGRISHQIIDRSVNCCCFLNSIPNPPLHLSTGCPLTGRAGVSDNNGLLVVLELPLEASPDTASTTPAVRNAPDFERPLPLHRRALCPAGQEEGKQLDCSEAQTVNQLEKEEEEGC